jgi:hypothetical protein
MFSNIRPQFHSSLVALGYLSLFIYFCRNWINMSL